MPSVQELVKKPNLQVQNNIFIQIKILLLYPIQLLYHKSQLSTLVNFYPKMKLN